MRLWAINNLKRGTKTQQLGPSWIKIHFLDHKLEMAQRRPEKNALQYGCQIRAYLQYIRTYYNVITV